MKNLPSIRRACLALFVLGACLPDEPSLATPMDPAPEAVEPGSGGDDAEGLPADENLGPRLENEDSDYRRLLARIADLEASGAASAAEVEELQARIRELELARREQQEATRTIIRQTFDTLGGRINEFVILGGTLEVATGRFEDYAGLVEVPLVLNTTEFDFEIQVNDWSIASVVLEYLDGSDFTFRSLEGDETFVDRINVDTAHLTLGDPERFWMSARVGQMILPFGISTGDPVADVLTIEDPLTVEMFEMKEVAVLLEAAFPTPTPRPPTARPAPPPVRPKVLAPLVGQLSRALGYRPYPVPPPQPNFILDTSPPPPFWVSVFTFNGDTFARPKDEENWTPTRHVGAAAGFRRRANPWSLDLSVGWSSSVFDSDFLGFEYRNFLDQIALVPGVAGAVKASLGPVGFVGEWDGALEDTRFLDDTDRSARMRPSAWQASVAYQLDWNPTVEAIGAQGTYVTASYSESRDMAGVIAILGGREERLGFVPRSRFLVGAGEWVADGLRLAVEYSRIEDYARSAGGTAETANGFAAMITMEW